MWETSSSFTRVAILLLVTCSFAAVWSDDQHRQAAYLMARREAWQPMSRPNAVVSPLPIGDRMMISDSHPSEIEACHSFPIALPAEIPPGQYRVADATGCLDTMIIHKQGVEQSATRRDLYFVDVPNLGPRYLIRIHPREVPNVANPAMTSAESETRE